MHVISRKKLREFGDEEPEAKAALDSWFHEAKKADWKTPAQIKEKYRSASILKNNRVVFNIAGNKYRLVVRINYEKGTVFVRFVGSHADYDEIEAGEI
jgi:mRNA interferase HigB